MLPRLVHLLTFSAVGTALYVKRGAQSQHDTTITGGNLHERAATLAPIDTSPADGITSGRVANSLPPLDSFIVDLNPPVISTNSWWVPYLAEPGDQNAAGPLPYQSPLDGSGVKFGVSTDRRFDGTSIQQPVRIDWLGGFTEHQGSFSGHKATQFDEQAVTVQYFQGNARMNAFLMPRSHYMKFKYEGATPKLEPQNASIKSFNGRSSPNPAVFTVTDTGDATYVIYALETVTLRASLDAITADAAYNNVIRLAKVSQESHRVLLDQYHSAYPTAAKLEYELGNTEGAIVFSWETVGSGELLMLTWPHHREVMQNGNFPPTSALGYLTTKAGFAIELPSYWPTGGCTRLGKQWRLTYKLSDVVWNSTRKLDSSCSDAVIKGLEYEVGQLKTSDAPVPSDFHYWGGALAAKARLAVIADDLGRQDLVAPTAWGGIINKAGATNEFVDFGNGYYNDHHFHYGYVLAIAATIANMTRAG
uniref:glucan endo-1,3-beta-D-glucosidase n=1 Tax=Bionectria ochroleuca TaxID=29856 RepID=A0A8H7N5D7_BIOOC